MYLVVTKVISESRKAEQNWPLFLSAISFGELRRSVDLMRHRGDSPQAADLEQWLLQLLQD